MRFILSVIILWLAMPTPCFALLENLPFIGTEFPFEVEIAKRDGRSFETLQQEVADAVAGQRDQSREFEVYDETADVIRFDRSVIRKVLESRGYFAAKIAGKKTEDTIIYTVQLGPQYTVRQIKFNFPRNVNTPSRYLLPLQEGEPLLAQKVLDTVDAVRAYLDANYCLFNVNASYKAEVDHSKQQGFITFTVSPSQNVRFAKPQLFGQTSVAGEYLYKKITFEKGQCFNRTVIERSRVALLQTNLLARVDTVIGEPIAGEVTVSFDVTERSHRTIKGGLGYATDLGPIVSLGWSHRNMFGSGQKLDTTLSYSEVEQSLEADLTLPNFLRDDQIMIIETDITREDTPAYEAVQGEVLATVTRKLFKHVAGSVGPGLEFSRVENNEGVEDYALLSFLFGLDFNNTGDIFNPKKGISAAIKSRPYVNLYDTEERFVEHSALFSVYHTLENWPTTPTLAFRLAAGTLNDATDDEVPLDHRFYVGGGGSVRGYEYQTISALDEDDDPLGGLSFSETSLEVRMQLTQSWGLVLFTDGGYAFATQTPKFFEDYLWSAGLGIRFYTSFAPIRFDIAAPLDARYDEEGERIDSPFQIYISLGQAF